MRSESLAPRDSCGSIIHERTCPRLTDRRHAAELLATAIHALPVEWGRIDTEEQRMELARRLLAAASWVRSGRLSEEVR